MVFCPRCGSKDVVDALCANCLRETEPLLKDHKELAPTICTRCKSGLVQGRWVKYKNVNEFIAKQIKPKLNFDKSKTITETKVLTQFDIEEIWEKKIKPKSIIIEVKGKISDKEQEYTEEYELPFTLKKDICTICNRQASHYFEGIIQLRNSNDEVKRFVYNQITKLNKSGVYLTSVIEAKEGTDFYVTDQKAIQQIGHDAAAKFGGFVKITSKLVTKDKNSGKDLYRVTVLIRMPKFSNGDIIEYEGKIIRVGRMSKQIAGFDLLRNKHTHVTIKDEDKVNMLEKHKTTIMTTHPELTVMDTETFQPIKVYNMKKNDYKNGEKVKIFFYNKKAYIIPDKEQR